MIKILYLFFCSLIFPSLALATESDSRNFAGIIFGIFVLVTLLITYFASKKILIKVIIMQQVGKYQVFKMDWQ